YRSSADRGPLGTTMNTSRTVGARRFRRNCVRAVVGYIVLVALAGFATRSICPSLVFTVPLFLFLVSYAQARPLLNWEAGLIWTILHPPQDMLKDEVAVGRWLP